MQDLPLKAVYHLGMLVGLLDLLALGGRRVGTMAGQHHAQPG